MYKPASYNSPVMILYNKFIPLPDRNRPLLIRIIAGKGTGNGLLFYL